MLAKPEQPEKKALKPNPTPYDAIEGAEAMSDLYRVMVSCIGAGQAVRMVKALVDLGNPQVSDLKNDVVALEGQLIDARELFVEFFADLKAFFAGLTGPMCKLKRSIKYKKPIIAGEIKDSMKLQQLAAVVEAMIDLNLTAVESAKKSLERWAERTGWEGLTAKHNDIRRLEEELNGCKRKVNEAYRELWTVQAELAGKQGRLGAITSMLGLLGADLTDLEHAKKQLESESARFRDRMANAPPSQSRGGFWVLSWSSSDSTFEQARQAAELSEHQLAMQKASVEEKKKRREQLESEKAELLAAIAAQLNTVPVYEKAVSEAEAAATEKAKEVSKAMKEVEEICKKHGGGPVAHVVKVLMAVTNMYEFSKGQPALSVFAKLMRNRLEEVTGLIEWFGELSDVQSQAQYYKEDVVPMIEHVDGIGPLLFIEQNMKPILLASIEAAQPVTVASETLITEQVGQLLIEAVDEKEKEN